MGPLDYPNLCFVKGFFFFFFFLKHALSIYFLVPIKIIPIMAVEFLEKKKDALCIQARFPTARGCNITEIWIHSLWI